jgi:thymidylate synthase
MNKETVIKQSIHTYNHEYETLLWSILAAGAPKEDRTGTGTVSQFGTRMSWWLPVGFPLITTKKVWFKGVVEELLWMLSGSTNNNGLVARGVHIWDEWAKPDGDLGPIYGKQWRSWECYPDGHGHTPYAVDQISWVINEIRSNPDSRRLVVSAWNVADLPNMALSPCHALFQFYVVDGHLSCQLYQRSADMFLGVPFNIASYALLTCLIAQQCDLKPGAFTWVGGDTHIYKNHFEQVREQLDRPGRSYPGLALRKRDSIFDYTIDDIELIGYDPHPPISAPVAI